MRNMTYEDAKYLVWCFEFEAKLKSCKSHADYLDFIKDAERHGGDCTSLPCPCIRCAMNEIEIKAQNMLDYFNNIETGHCGKICLIECEFNKDE